MDSEITRLFLAHSTGTLRKMTSHIDECLSRLSDDQIWTRGSQNENSAGNLVLHLCGNVRQWIISGVGGEQDTRNRDLEFSTKGGTGRRELLDQLHATVDEAIQVVEAVTPERLVEVVNPQGGSAPVLDAIYRVVGHFQQHTGQIIFATKLLSGEDLGLYRP